jgi:hypothetical protein
MMMAGAVDSDRVLRALRFGWALAETRGRLRSGPPAGQQTAGRPGHALPLSDERTWREQTIETEMVVITAASELGLDSPLSELSGQGGNGTACGRLEDLSRALGADRKAANEEHEAVHWEELCEFLYAWDAKIQDTLAADSFAVASGYQLGRGLAETYWALQPGHVAASDPASAAFLLGAGRMTALGRLLPRLSAYFQPSVAAAVEVSVGAWAKAAANGVLDSAAGVGELHEQVRIWHDVLLVGQPPAARLDPSKLLKRARTLRPLLRAFVPEATIGLLSLAAALGAAALFALGSGNEAVAPILSVLTVFGVTSAGAIAKAKNQANGLFDELRQTMNLDLLEEAITRPPARPYLDSDTKDQPKRPALGQRSGEIAAGRDRL